MNLFKIRATIYRDIREYFTNYAVLTVLLMPPIMALMYSTPARNVREDLPDAMIFILLGTALASIATNVPLMLYAEENEHGLLKLVTHNVSDLMNGMAGRSILVLFVTAAVTVISLLIAGQVDVLSWPLVSGLGIAALVFLNLGLIAGLLAKLQSTSTVYGVLVLFLLGMTPIIETFFLNDSHLLMKLAEWTPVYQLMAIYNNAGVMPYVIMLVWLGLTTFSVYLAVLKRAKTL